MSSASCGGQTKELLCPATGRGAGTPPAGRAPTRGVGTPPGKSSRGGGGQGARGAALRLTIACSILLSMATTLAPEALEESGEAER